MSLYQNLDMQNDSIQNQTQAIRNMNTSNQPSTADMSFNERVKLNEANKAELSQKYNNGIELSNDQYKFLTTTLANSTDPAADEAKLAQAMLYARNYDEISVDYAMKNLDALNSARLGNVNSYDISGYKKLENSFKVGNLTVDRGRLAEQFYIADQAGEDTSQYDSMIQQLDGELESLSEYAPKTWVGKLFSLSAQTIPYSWHVFKSSAIGGAIGNAIAPGVGTVLSIAGSFTEGYRLSKFGQYYDLVKAGVDKKAAQWTSSLSGLIQAAVESIPAFSVETRLAQMVTGGAKGFTEQVMKRAIANGTLGQIGLLASRYLLNATAEGGEELIQSVTESLADNIAYQLSDMKAPHTSREVIVSALQDFAGGFGAALILGLPEVAFNAKTTAKYAADLKADAKQTDSREVFIKNHINDQFFENVDEKANKETLSTIWQINHTTESEMTESEAKTYEVDTDINDEYTGFDENGNPVEPVASEELPAPKRLEDGRIRVQDSASRVVQNLDGTETRQLNIGSIDSDKNYGAIKYTIDAKNNTITIENVTQIRGQEDLAREGIIELARRNQGWEIEWNPETVAQQEMKDKIINDPANQNKGKLNWFTSDRDVSTEVKIAQKLQEKFKNVTQKETLLFTNLLKYKAEAENTDLNTWWNNHVVGIESTNQQGIKGSIDIDMKAAKATIYAAEKGDFSTLEHEFFHLASVTDLKASENLAKVLKEASKDPEFKKYLSSHRQITNMDPDAALQTLQKMGEDAREWNREEFEIAATLYECYRQNGKTFNNKLKAIFEQIAEWFHRIYKTLKGENILNDEIVKAYDAYFDKNASFREAAQKAEVKGDSSITLSQKSARDMAIEKYTDKSQYKAENIEGRVYIHELAKEHALTSSEEQKKLDANIEAAHKLSDHYNCDVFIVPEGDDNHALYVEKWKNPDAITKGLFIDFKSLSTSNQNTIQKRLGEAHKQADSVYFKLNESSSVDDVTEAVKRKLGGANSSYEGFQIVISDSKDNFVSFEVKNRELIASSLFVAPTINGSHNYNDNKDNINVKRLNQAEAEYNDTYNYLISNPQNFNGTNWIAPNGKVSNLGERQYVQVRTESFKNWFGDWENNPNNASKVLDENGEPKVVYHGSSFAGFDSFKDSKSGIYFTDSKELAGTYAGETNLIAEFDEAGNIIKDQNDTWGKNRLYPVFLNIKDPATLDAKGGSWTDLKNEGSWAVVYDADQEVIEYAKSKDAAWDKYSELVDEYEDPIDVQRVPAENGPMMSTADFFREEVKENKDGGIIYNVNDPLYNYLSDATGNVYVVRDPNQIKSATQNNGQFRTDSNNILYQTVYHGSGAEFDKFLNEKIGTGNGAQTFGYGHYFAESDLVAKEYASTGAYPEDLKELSVRTAKYNVSDLKYEIEGLQELIDAIDGKEGELYDLNRKELEKKGKLNENEKKRLTRVLNATKSSLKHWEEKYESLVNKQPSRRNLYKVDIPNVGYLNWNDNLSKDQALSLVNKIKQLLPVEERKEFNKTYGLSDLSNITGGNLYMTASDILGGDKEASKFFSKLGFVGIKYQEDGQVIIPKGAEGTYNYVVFDPKDITILKAWQYDTDEEATTLYQLSNEIDNSYIIEAKTFDSRDEFIDFEMAMDFEPKTAQEYGDIWDKAHNIYEVKNGSTESPITADMSDDEKDSTFKAIMDTDEGIKAFINRMREAFNARFDVQRAGGRIDVYTEEDYQDVIQKIQNADRIENEASQFIVRISKGNKELTETEIKQVRGMINNSLRDYRDLYAQVIGDENLAAGVYSEYMPDIKDSRAAGMKIAERKNLVDRLQGEEIRDKVRRGTEKFDGTAEKVMAVYDKELKELQNKYDKLSEQYKNTYLKMSVAEQDVVNKDQQIKAMEKRINKETQTIRTKLDAGSKVSSEQMARLNSWKDKLDLLHEEVKDLRKQDRVKAAIEKKEALDNLKKQIREKNLDKAAVEEVHRYKRDLYNSIMAPVSNNVDYSYVQKIDELRATLTGVSGYQNKTITIDGQKMSLADFRKGVEDGSIKIEGLSDYQLKRYLNTSLADLTIVDLESMKDAIDYYSKMGKQMWQAKVDKRLYEAKMRQNQFINDIRKSRHYKDDENLPNSVESKTSRKVGIALRGALNKTFNMSRKFQMLANDTEGPIWQFAVQKKRDLQSAENAAKNARIRPLENLQKELGVSLKEAYQTVTLDLSTMGYNTQQTYTLSDLIYGLMAQKEDRNKQAFAYGNLVSTTEKAEIRRTIGNDDRTVNEYIKQLGGKRNAMFVAQAETILAEHPNLMKLAEAYDADFQAQGPRLFNLSVEQYNKPMEQVDHYLPIMRQDNDGTDLGQKIQDDIYNRNAGKNKTTPEKGMLQSRIDINPEHQKPVKMDFFSIWTESMNDQEHLIHTLGYVRELNAVFKNHGSAYLRNAIKNTYGVGMLTDIDNYINEIANPNLFTDTQGINSIVKVMRGGVYTGYLGFKASSIVTQAITSPAAFLQYVSPAELANGLMKMTAQPNKTWATVCQLSPMMEHRSMDPIVEEISKMAKEVGTKNIKKLYNNFLEYGTRGLEMIDRWAVAGGWIACYEKKLSEFEYQTDPKAIEEAAKFADYVVFNTQPLSDITEIAPLFKHKSEFAKAFTQFMVSLNVIWNNVVYDNGIKAISNLRNKEISLSEKKQIFGKVVGCLAGYAIAGTLLTMIKEGFKEDDEPEDWVKEMIYGATTQFTSAVPLFGSGVDNLVRGAITGEKGYEYQSALYPALDKVFSGASTLITLDKNDSNYDQRFKRATSKFVEGAALMVGFPTSGFKELGKVITEDGFKESFVTGDFDFTLNPAALLGR